MVETRGFTTTDGIDLNEIFYDTVIPILDIYNAEELLDLRGMLTFDWDESYYKFAVNSTWKFQKLGEAEKPISRMHVYGKRQKDAVKYGLGIDYTFDWLMSEQASSTEIAKLAAKAISTDREVVTAVLLNVCLASAGTSGFYNASFETNEVITTPPPYGVATFASTHTHYVASGSATLRLSDITAAKLHLKEHGYKGNIMGFCNADFTKNVEDLAGFFITTTAQYSGVGSLENEVVMDGWRGRMLGIDWVETQWMPDDYFLLIATRPDQDKPIMFIQKKNTSARGLILTPGSYDVRYPIIEASYLRWFDAVIAYRGAGVVYKLTAGAYSDPSITDNFVD